MFYTSIFFLHFAGMANKSRKSTSKNSRLQDEPITQPPRISTARDHSQSRISTTRDHSQSARGDFDISNCWDTSMNKLYFVYVSITS